MRALSIQRLEGSPWLWDLIGAGLRREVWQAGVVGRRSGCVRDGVGLLCEEPHGNGSRRERKDLGRGPRDAEVVCVSTLVPGHGIRLCSDDGRFGLELGAMHVAVLVSRCQHADGHETGGVLIGYYNPKLAALWRVRGTLESSATRTRQYQVPSGPLAGITSSSVRSHQRREKCVSAISKDIYGSAVGNMDLIVGNSCGGIVNFPEGASAAKPSLPPSSSIQMSKMPGRPASVTMVVHFLMSSLIGVLTASL